MSAEAALVAYMAASGPAGLVGRWRPQLAGQGEPLPYAIYTRVSSVPGRCQDGRRGPTMARFQVDVWAATATAAKSLANAIAAAADSFRGTYAGTVVQAAFEDGQRDLPVARNEGESDGARRVAVEIMVWYEE